MGDKKHCDFEVFYYRQDSTISHSYQETWIPDEMFCPNCGKKGNVWVQNSEGDYYVGPLFLCTACSAEWTIQGPNTFRGNKQVEQRLKHLREKEWEET